LFRPQGAEPRSRDSQSRSLDVLGGVRRYYAPFESEIRAGTADIHRHEMPGGQYTNPREQAHSLGIEHRWTEVSQAYAEVNQMLGDIVKVTPTSKVVGDLAFLHVQLGNQVAKGTIDRAKTPGLTVAVRPRTKPD
jgi:pyruvate carboxylase